MASLIHALLDAISRMPAMRVFSIGRTTPRRWQRLLREIVFPLPSSGVVKLLSLLGRFLAPMKAALLCIGNNMVAILGDPLKTKLIQVTALIQNFMVTRRNIQKCTVRIRTNPMYYCFCKLIE